MNLPNLESAFTLIWQISLRACVLIVVALIMQALVRLPARFRYALGLMVLLRLFVPVTPASSWSIFNLTRHARLAPSAAPIIPSAVPLTVRDAAHAIQPLIAISQPSRLTLGQWVAVFWLCGGAGFLLAVFWRHRKFARRVAQLPTATDTRLIELVGSCKSEAGVRRAVRITNAPAGSTAAVFGFLRPHLLLPEGMMDSLDGREVRLVLLHELFHIRRRDVLVNWISVLALALHWFNPLAWVAMRRLRADQELACDAEVLGLIEPSDRGAYGRTLLKHLPDFPAARMAAGLVPLITSRHNIKRRIIMITEFKNTGGLARSLFAFLLMALGGLTFTRASDDLQPVTTTAGLPSTTLAATPFRDSPAVSSSPKANQDYGAEYVKQSTLLEQLKLMDSNNHSRFIQALSVAASDSILNSLIEKELAQESRLAGLKTSFGPESQQIWEEVAVIEDLKQKVEQRADGVIAGMTLQVASLKAASITGVFTDPNFRVSVNSVTPNWGNPAIATSAATHSRTPSQSVMTPFPDTSTVTGTDALDAFLDEQIQQTIRETYHSDRSFLINSLHEKGMTYEAWKRGQREYWIGQLKKDLFSK